MKKNIIYVVLVICLSGCCTGGTAYKEGPAEDISAELAGLRQELMVQLAQNRAYQKKFSVDRVEEGKPVRLMPVMPLSPEGEEVAEKEGCFYDADAFVASWAGTGCEDYKSEVNSHVIRCTNECDKNKVAATTVRNAMASCSGWCQSKGCGTASFIPPPSGCSEDLYECSEDKDFCKNDKCSIMEYCFIQQKWNCFCRDMVLP